jgi:hypothetical protein
MSHLETTTRPRSLLSSGRERRAVWIVRELRRTRDLLMTHLLSRRVNLAET